MSGRGIIQAYLAIAAVAMVVGGIIIGGAQGRTVFVGAGLAALAAFLVARPRSKD